MKCDVEYNKLEEERDRAREEYDATHGHCHQCNRRTLDVIDYPITTPQFTFTACSVCGEPK